MSTSGSEIDVGRLGSSLPSPARMPVYFRVLDLLRNAISGSIVLLGAAILVTAFGTRTVRVYGEPRQQWGGGTATDSIRWFQGWVLLCVLGTGILLIAALGAERPRWRLLPVSIAGLILVARNIDAWHQRLRDEQAGPRTYLAEIPVRAPDGGPTLDAMGRPLHFGMVSRTYEKRIPGELDVLVLGSFVTAALLTLLMVLWLTEDIRQNYRVRKDSETIAV